MAVPASPGPAATVPPPASKRGRRYRPPASVANIVLVIVIVALVGSLVFVYTVPFTTSYSYRLATSPTGEGAAALNTHSGAHVYGNFYTTNGGPVSFGIQDSIGNYVYENSQNSSVFGSFSFTASYPPYTFTAFSYAAETVVVYGHYTAPLV